jgi:hypothetical protein
VFSGLLAVTALAAAWHVAGRADGGKPGYPVTDFFVGSVDLAFTAAYAVVSLLLGCAFRQSWPVALGMLAPLPIGVVYECALDPTNHNLIPFEVALVWVPAFVLAFGAALLGARIRGEDRARHGGERKPGVGA